MKPQVGILWWRSRNSLGFKRLCWNSSWNYAVYILNCSPVYPISNLDGTISLIETNYVLIINWNRFLSVLNDFLRDLFSKVEEYSQAPGFKILKASRNWQFFFTYLLEEVAWSRLLCPISKKRYMQKRMKFHCIIKAVDGRYLV